MISSTRQSSAVQIRATVSVVTVSFRESLAITRELIDLAAADPKIGYEASCHYFYSSRNLVEKLICLDRMRKELNGK